MKESQQSISEWIEQTFGPVSTNARIVTRANEEMAELLRSVTINEAHPDLGEEMADVVICFYRLASRIGVNLQGEIDKKMTVNRARQWELDGSGCGYHS